MIELPTTQRVDVAEMVKSVRWDKAVRKKVICRLDVVSRSSVAVASSLVGLVRLVE